jgi:hypothetical protein
MVHPTVAGWMHECERVVRLDTERGEHIVFTVRPAAAQPVKLDEREFYQALARLGRQVHPPANPQEAGGVRRPADRLGRERADRG